MAKTSKTKKATTKANATVAKKSKTTEQAPAEKKVVKKVLSQRPNRTTTGKSEFGNRKWIQLGVTEVDAKGNIKATSESTATAFPLEKAEAIKAAALKRDDVIKARLNYKKAEDGQEMRGVWISTTDLNGELPKQEAA